MRAGGPGFGARDDSALGGKHDATKDWVEGVFAAGRGCSDGRRGGGDGGRNRPIAWPHRGGAGEFIAHAEREC